VRLSEQFGRKVATADEARKIMKIGVWYDTVEETLFNLGLPPNRPEGYKGFLAYEPINAQGSGTATSLWSASQPRAWRRQHDRRD
jgi:hypothetical protein